MRQDEPGTHLVPFMVWLVLLAQIVVLLVLLLLPGCAYPGELMQSYCREDRPACVALRYTVRF